MKLVLILLLASTAAFANTTRKRLDVLFVIDNSGSMQSAQLQACSEVHALVAELDQKAIDYHFGVISTDLWKGNYNWGTNYLRLKDGYPTHTEVFVVTPKTPNAAKVLDANMRLGIAGSGDERAFQSAAAALTYEGNKDFRRSTAPLAIVILSDEDDFSWDGNADLGENYASPNLVPVRTYYEGFKKLAKNLSVSTISIQDSECLAKSSPAANVGIRYNELATSTGGIQRSICDVPAAMKRLTQHLVKIAR